MLAGKLPIRLAPPPDEDHEYLVVEDHPPPDTTIHDQGLPSTTDTQACR
jgi:hypothetical protein